MPRNDLITYPKKTGYRKHTGMVSWLLHRITGVVIGLYLIMHILGATGTVGFFGTITTNSIVEAVLILAIGFHAFNGIRILIIEFGNGAKPEVFGKQFMAVVFLTLVLSAIGAFTIFGS